MPTVVFPVPSRDQDEIGFPIEMRRQELAHGEANCVVPDIEPSRSNTEEINQGSPFISFTARCQPSSHDRAMESIV